MHRKAVLLLSVTVLLAVTLTACSRPRARLATQTAQPTSANEAALPGNPPTLQPSATLLPSSTPFPTATPLVINRPLPVDLQSDLDEIDALLEDLLREVSAGGNGITVP